MADLFRKTMFAVVWSVGLLLLVPASGTSAQSSSLGGRVTDPRDAGLPGVTVVASSERLTAPVLVTTDEAGVYVFQGLESGDYTVMFSLDGFQAERRSRIAVAPGEETVLDVRLSLAPLTERVDVVAVTPLLGADVDRDRIPAMVAVLGASEITSRGTPSIADSLHEQLGTVTLEGATGNLFQPTLRFRGFTASPLLGLPQGVAVYQNGVRINEPFGDTVQFDLMPQFAMNQIQLSAGADPTYGLNALGGALAAQLKNGFDFTGFRGEFSGGSFERFLGTAEYGVNNGRWGLYMGATRFDEQGWRVQSPSEVTQAVADIGYRGDRVNAGVTVTYADTDLNGNGAAPIELLAIDRSAVFTYPDNTKNRLAFVQSRYDLEISSAWSLQLTAYYRDLDRRTLNGDEAEFGVCDDDALPGGAPGDTLCFGADDDDDDDEEDALLQSLASLDDDDEDEDEEEGIPLVDARNPGRFITEADALGNAAFNRTNTKSRGYGATAQATATAPLGDRENLFVVGASGDLADIAFDSHSEVGTLTRDRGVDGSGLLAGLYGQAPDDQFNTDIDTVNQALGLYFSDTLSMTDRAHLTVSGRFNWAGIKIVDRLGTSLNGEHAFARFNPAVGAVFETSDTVSLFARYSEANRAPTAAELSCADPAEPCRVPNAFISDPPLEQAVARSVEGGIRGDVPLATGSLDWSASIYRIGINDDILFIASSELIGTGFFQNAGDTRRVGLDLDLRGQNGRLGWYASYGLVEATFQSVLELPGNDEVNDATTLEGTLQVEPGDRLAGIPRHNIKAGLAVAITDLWDVAAETVTVSSRIFVGDEGNDQAPLNGYAVTNLRSAFRVTDEVELFFRVDNLFDKRYETFGALAELEVELEEVPDADDPRFLGPGAPRSGFAGVRVRF
jgi:outer membrane receptor protein involved in Fe transport